MTAALVALAVKSLSRSYQFVKTGIKRPQRVAIPSAFVIESVRDVTTAEAERESGEGLRLVAKKVARVLSCAIRTRILQQIR
jgi:hypothetical protein